MNIMIKKRIIKSDRIWYQSLSGLCRYCLIYFPENLEKLDWFGAHFTNEAEAYRGGVTSRVVEEGDK